MSLIKKVLWPTAIALGLLVFLGAIGGSSARTASAAEGDFCTITGPKVIAVGDTVIYIARLDGDTDHDTSVSIDNIIGNSKITSVLDGEDFDDYEKVNPTNIIFDVDEFDAFDIDEDLTDILELLDFEFDFSANVCGISTTAALRAIIAEGIDRGSNTADFGDEDIDCPTGATCTVGSAVITAVVTALAAAIDTDDVRDCDDLGEIAEDAAILAGAPEGVGAQFNDFIEDVCDDEFEILDDTVLDGEGFLDNYVLVDVTCVSAGNFDISFSDEDENDDSISMNVRCLGNASSRSTLTASPTTVEIVPAPGNVSNSLITVVLIDSDGNQATAASDVDFTTNRCSIESSAVDTVAEWNAIAPLFVAMNANVPATAAAIQASLAATTQPDSTRQQDSMAPIDLGTRTVAGAVLMCDPQAAPGAAPGPATVTAIIDVVNGNDIILTTTVTVVGPPASIVVAASPTSVRCGEKATITATIKDAIGQNVSEHTRVEAVTNNGGTLAGTGAVANQAGLVSPLSSTVGETFAGVFTTFLLTSEQHVGPYEVVVTSGGTGALGGALGGVFSTAPVSAQVTVTCSLPQVAAPQAPAAAVPTVTGPRVGTGGITPPNTGDAGLVDARGGSSWVLFAGIAGVFALSLAAGVALKKDN